MGDSRINEQQKFKTPPPPNMDSEYHVVQHQQKKGDTPRAPLGGSRATCWCLVLATTLVITAALPALILGVLHYLKDCQCRPGPPGSMEHITEHHKVANDYATADGDVTNPSEVWVIHMAVGDGNLEYIDHAAGVIQGYNIDVINAVCRRANKNCEIVLDSYSRCWSDGYGGEGLMSRWYHACSGWRITLPRQLTFKFTDPFQKKVPAVFVIRSAAGSSDQFDWRNLTGKKIGFYQGWFSDLGCLSRQEGIEGLPLEESQIAMFKTSAALESALNRKRIDAAFIGTDVDLVTRSVIVSDDLQCSLEGAGMMMRKDTHLNRWWNPAWRALVKSDEYREICDDIERIHGHKPGLKKEDLCRNTTAIIDGDL